MDIQPQTTKPISDDQELAKVLAGVTQESNANLEFEETPAVTQLPTPDPIVESTPEMPKPVIGYNPPSNNMPSSFSSPSPATNDLESIKKDALIELRPLVDKLELSAEEKFDIYLLLLRSTDDKSIIAPAYAAARGIADESKRAQALLDVIKEIDYLSTNQQ